MSLQSRHIRCGIDDTAAAQATYTPDGDVKNTGVLYIQGGGIPNALWTTPLPSRFLRCHILILLLLPLQI